MKVLLYLEDDGNRGIPTAGPQKCARGLNASPHIICFSPPLPIKKFTAEHAETAERD
jgi:hypothetical protein